MLRDMNDLHGFTIGATDGDIGSVKESYVDDVSNTVRYVVVDTGGWLSNREVLLRSRLQPRRVRNATLRVYPAGPHGLVGTSEGQLSADLLAFFER